jgi:hypothetical protein
MEIKVYFLISMATVVARKIATEINQRCLIVCKGAITNNNKPIKKAYINKMKRSLTGYIGKKKLAININNSTMEMDLVPHRIK